MDAFIPNTEFFPGQAESSFGHSFVRTDPATASPIAAVGTWFEPLDDSLIDTSDHPVEVKKLPLKVRFGVILGGALLGWAVPIAIATRLL